MDNHALNNTTTAMILTSVCLQSLALNTMKMRLSHLRIDVTHCRPRHGGQVGDLSGVLLRGLRIYGCFNGDT